MHPVNEFAPDADVSADSHYQGRVFARQRPGAQRKAGDPALAEMEGRLWDLIREEAAAADKELGDVA